MSWNSRIIIWMKDASHPGPVSGVKRETSLYAGGIRCNVCQFALYGLSHWAVEFSVNNKEVVICNFCCKNNPEEAYRAWVAKNVLDEILLEDGSD